MNRTSIVFISVLVITGLLMAIGYVIWRNAL